jgi:hypothetical protein
MNQLPEDASIALEMGRFEEALKTSLILFRVQGRSAPAFIKRPRVIAVFTSQNT